MYLSLKTFDMQCIISICVIKNEPGVILVTTREKKFEHIRVTCCIWGCKQHALATQLKPSFWLAWCTCLFYLLWKTAMDVFIIYLGNWHCCRCYFSSFGLTLCSRLTLFFIQAAETQNTQAADTVCENSYCPVFKEGGSFTSWIAFTKNMH